MSASTAPLSTCSQAAHSLHVSTTPALISAIKSYETRPVAPAGRYNKKEESEVPWRQKSVVYTASDQHMCTWPRRRTLTAISPSV